MRFCYLNFLSIPFIYSLQKLRKDIESDVI